MTYDVRSYKKQIDNALHLVSVGLITIVAVGIYFVGPLIFTTSGITRVFSIMVLSLLLLYFCSFLFYYVSYRKQRGEFLEDMGTSYRIINRKGEFVVEKSEIVAIVGVSSTFCSSLIFVTEESHYCVDFNTVCYFMRDTRKEVGNFFSLAKKIKSETPCYKSIVNSRRAKEKNIVKLPLFVFDIDFYSKSALRTIDRIRDLNLGIVEVKR